MRGLSKWLVAAAVAAWPGMGAWAGEGTTGAAFLKIAPGARAAGLGEAYTAAVDEASAVVWNPAGLALITKPEMSATRTQWLQEGEHNFLAAATPGTGGVWGVGVVTLSLPHIPERLTDTEDADGEFEARDAAYTLSYGRKLGATLAWGVSAHYIQQTLGGVSAAAPALSLGTLWRPGGKTWTFGAAVRNAGGEITFDQEGDPLPMTVALGAAARLWRDRCLLSTDLRWPREGTPSGSAGVEYVRPLFAEGRGRLRAGYNSAAADAEDGTGVALGLGLGFGRWDVDVTWAPYGVLGDTFRYAFRLQF